MTRTILLLVLLLLAPAWAQSPVEAETERRAAELASQLRCLVCQNQSIAESNAELAVDLRREIREQIGKGRSDADIIDFMVQRYGDFVLYRPPVKTTTLLLWFGPALLFLTAVLVLRRYLRERARRVEEPVLSEEERARARALLAGEQDEGRA